ncbi:hypothetical protein ACFLXC_04450 [Chloroflexota bacterium]
MSWRDYRILICFFTAAVIFGIVSWLALSPINGWAAITLADIVAFGFVIIGSGVNSLILAHRMRKEIVGINVLLKKIEQSQETLIKEQREQHQKAGVHSSIGPTTRAFSQLYLDYMNNQKGKE